MADAGRSAGAGAGADAAALGVAAPALVQTVWMRVLMESLRRAGVGDLVVSPGSRSTPLVLAAEYAGLRCHTIIDERSAGFFALGRAKATGAPVALVCTSGSAGAHYYPAVIEAVQAYVPLVVLTADRPPELRGCAAPQTVDQNKLFGDRVRHFADLGTPEADKGRLRALRRQVAQAVSLAQGPVPGPVHLNVPARKPLEPVRPVSPADIAVVRRGDDVLAETMPRVITAPVRAPEQTLESLADACITTARGLIVAGPALPWDTGMRRAAAHLARVTGFPLLAEASSQLRFGGLPGLAGGDAGEGDSGGGVCDGFDLLLSSRRFRAGSQPDLVLQLGAPPTSKGWDDYMAENPDSVHCVIAAWGWNDPRSSADMLVVADPVDAVARLADKVAARGGRREPSPWARRFAAGNALVWRCVDQVLGEAADAGAAAEAAGAGAAGAGASSEADGAMREGQAMRAVVDALPPGTLLSLGNSLPIRTVDTYCRAAHPAAGAEAGSPGAGGAGSARDLTVLSQRGANGIDGLISAAAGAAGAAEGPIGGALARRVARGAAGHRPVALVLGDVSFSHDIGGLAAARGLRAPLAIVVIDNQGGRIFEQLPVAPRANDRDRADGPSGTPGTDSAAGAGRGLFEKHWLTVPGCDVQAAAAVFGHGYERVADPRALSQAVDRALAPGAGCTVIHALVAPHSAAEDRARILAAVDAAVDRLPAVTSNAEPGPPAGG